MNANKYYLIWSYEKPMHPRCIYQESWYTGFSWYGTVNPTNKSLDQWRLEKVDYYKALREEYKRNGKIMKLSYILNPNDEDINSIETDADFIKWCN